MKYEKESQNLRQSKVRIWLSDDSLHHLLWTFNAYQRNEWIWENAGYCQVKDSNRLELILTGFRHFSPKVQKRTGRKIKVGEALYIINIENGAFYIEAKGKKGKFSLIKV